MKKTNLLSLIFIGSIFWLQMTQTSCVNDKLPEPNNQVCDSLQITYDNQVKPIIDVNCAFVGCHVQGFVNGDLSSFATMTPYINGNNAPFELEVITNKTMPIGGFLSDADLEILQCWVNSDYPEN